MKNFKPSAEIKKLINSVKGEVSDGEGGFLYHTAKNVTGKKKGVIVEIGAWEGRSTVCLAQGSKDGSRARVFSIDYHQEGEDENPHDIYVKNLARSGVSDIVTHLCMTSEEASKGWDAPIEFLFIDGNHNYKFVKQDFELWSPFCVDGAIIAFDDSTYDGVKVFLPEVFNRGDYRALGIIDSITYIMKSREGSLLRTNYILLLNKAHDIARHISLPRPIRSIVQKLGQSVIQYIQ